MRLLGCLHSPWIFPPDKGCLALGAPALPPFSLSWTQPDPGGTQNQHLSSQTHSDLQPRRKQDNGPKQKEGRKAVPDSGQKAKTHPSIVM